MNTPLTDASNAATLLSGFASKARSAVRIAVIRAVHIAVIRAVRIAVMRSAVWTAVMTWMSFWIVVTVPASAQDQQLAEPAAIAIEEIADAEGDVEANAAEVDRLAADRDPQVLRLRRYVRVNCALARRVCELSEGEEQAFTQLNDAWIAKQMHESVEPLAANPMGGIFRFLGGARRDDRPREVKLPEVKKRVDLAIDAALTPGHREAFQQERDERVQFRKQALAAVLVTALDESLYLSPEQRTQLEPEVAAWLTTDLYWEFYFQNSSYLPDIPQQVLAKALSPEQLVVVQAAHKHNLERTQFEDQMMQQEPPAMIER